MSEEHRQLYVEGDPQLITARRGNYRAKVDGQGYVGPRHQVHHVLPCGALTESKEDFLSTKELGVKLALERITTYDVNQAHNLIGLPTSAVYAAKFETPMTIFPTLLVLLPKVFGPVASCDLPIHLWAHAAYSRKAKLDVDKVWSELSVTIENHKPVSANDIGSALKSVSRRLRKGLNAAAKKKLRTKSAWPHERVVFGIFP